MTAPFIDPIAIVETAKLYLPIAEQSAQDAFVRGDMIDYARRSRDAGWYRQLIDSYSDEAEAMLAEWAA